MKYIDGKRDNLLQKQNTYSFAYLVCIALCLNMFLPFTVLVARPDNTGVM